MDKLYKSFGYKSKNTNTSKKDITVMDSNSFAINKFASTYNVPGKGKRLNKIHGANGSKSIWLSIYKEKY